MVHTFQKHFRQTSSQTVRKNDTMTLHSLAPPPKSHKSECIKCHCAHKSRKASSWTISLFVVYCSRTHLTQLSGKLRRTFAHKAVRHQVALAAILAWSAVTFISLDFTVSPHKTWRALAVVPPLSLLRMTWRKVKLSFI